MTQALALTAFADIVEQLPPRLPIWSAPFHNGGAIDWPDPVTVRALSHDRSVYPTCGACNLSAIDCECGEDVFALATFGRTFSKDEA